jgi:hypothetical protein
MGGETMNEEINQGDIKLEVDGVYKIYGLSAIACTSTEVVKVVQFQGGDSGRWVFREKGKRKLFTMKMDEYTVILPEAHTLLADSETNRFQGSAMIILIGTPEEVQHIVDTYNLNPHLNKGLIGCRGLEEDPDETRMAYRIEAEKIALEHAPIRRTLERTAKAVLS